MIAELKLKNCTPLIARGLRLGPRESSLIMELRVFILFKFRIIFVLVNLQRVAVLREFSQRHVDGVNSGNEFP